MRVKILSMSFTKKDSDVKVLVGVDDLRKVVQSNDSELSNVISLIRKNIPARYENKNIGISVYIYVDKNNDPSINTIIKYPISFGKSLRDTIDDCSETLNSFFKKYVLETLKMMKNGTGKI